MLNRGIAACDHHCFLDPIMADLQQNGKSQFMEPLSRQIRLPEVRLDRQSREPLYKQVARQLATPIRESEMQGSLRLPSTRHLA
jgi:hypothetical protein